MATTIIEPFDSLSAWTLQNSPVASTAQSYRSGSSLLIDATGSAKYISRTISGRQYVARFYYYIETDTSGSASILQVTAGNTWTLQARTGRKLRTFTNTGGTDSGVLNLAQWYCIDVLVDTSANPGSIQYYIDGVSQTGQTRAVAAADQTLVQIGNTATNTYKNYFDEYREATTTAEYPLLTLGTYVARRDPQIQLLSN
jgi:hypothetical protein